MGTRVEQAARAAVNRQRQAAEQQKKVADRQRRVADQRRKRTAARLAQSRAAAERRASRRARIRALPPHARRRRRLLRWSWLPALLLVAFAWNLLALGPGYRDARAAYDAGEEWDAIDAFDRVDRWTFVERWKGAFNAGTARYRAGLYGSAVDHLDRALETVPDEHRCAVQTNRVLALQAGEQEYSAEAEEQLERARAVAEALAARDADEPYDEEILEPRYEGADAPTVADELDYAHYLLRMAAEDAALAAEALADPACTPPPSSGGGGQDEQDQGGSSEDQGDQGEGDEGEDDQGAGGGQDDAEAAPTPREAAEQRMQELLELAGDVEQLAHAAEQGTLEGVPEPGAGQQDAPDPAEAEAQRQAELAERNQQAGGSAGTQAPGGGQGSGTTRGGGDAPGTGGGGGGRRNW